MAVENVTEKGCEGVYRDHCEDADDMLLLVGSQVVKSVLENVPNGQGDGEACEAAAEVER